MAGSQAALLHGGRGQGREADDIADGVDVFDLGTVEGINLQALAVVGLQPGLVELQGAGRALATHRVEQRLSADDFARFENRLDERLRTPVVATAGRGFGPFNAGNLFTEAKGNARPAQLLLKVGG